MTLVEFLRVELAPTPGRMRATLRLVVGSLFCVVLVMGLHIPYGHWAVITLFTVSLPDAGASLRKGLQRVAGTVLGGGAALAAMVVFADQPWFRVPLIGLGCGVALFLSRTMTAPYIGLLGGLTFAILLPGMDARTATETALWRILVVTIGVAVGTLTNLFLWPDDPEEMLLDDVGRSLALVERLIDRRLAGDTGLGPDPLAASALGRQLDLLTNAESRYPRLRRRHAEQLALVTEIDRMVTAALLLSRLAPAAVNEAARRRLTAIAASLAAARTAVESRRPALAAPVDAHDDAALAAELLPVVVEIERALGGIALATAYVGRVDEGPSERATDPAARTPLFTPAFSVHNVEALCFAAKGALAASISYVIYQGLAWPEISTCVPTCVIVAQSTTGAGAQKALLRAAGGVLGGILGAAVVIFAMPNTESLGGLVVVMGIAFGIAAWLNVGSPRIAYVGLQTAMALALYTLDSFGPTTHLGVGRDRVIGILLGIAVMMVIDRTIWPVLARRALHQHLAAALRLMAQLSSRAVHEGPALVKPAAYLRRAIYGELGTTLRLRDESRFEPGANTPLAVTGYRIGMEISAASQEVFLALLALVRHRIDVDLSGLTGDVVAPLRRLAHAIGTALDAAADRIDGRSGTSLAARDAVMRAAREGLVRELAATLAPAAAALPHVAARVALYRQVVQGLLRTLDLVLTLPVALLPEPAPPVLTATTAAAAPAPR